MLISKTKLAAWLTLVITFVCTGPAYAEQLRNQVGGGLIVVDIGDGRLSVTREQIGDWVNTAARAVSQYYGHFPVRRLGIHIQPVSGSGISGTAYGHDLHIDIRLGRSATEQDFNQDWVLTHEMLHMAFPDVPDAHQWMKEGISTYAERVARAQIGSRQVDQMWADLVQKLPQGQPRLGDRGLDYTHSWGRTYWGGAIFCLWADVMIRRRTNNEYGLQHALRAILVAGGTLNKQWPLRKALAIGDRAVGVPVLTELYEQMRADAVTVDLSSLWAKLGVDTGFFAVKLRDDAPEAHIRKAITTPIDFSANR